MSEDGSWPWAVAVTQQNGYVITSGTLISAFYVLTFKQAISNSVNMYIIPGGANLMSSLMSYKVNKVILHPDPLNDLAILELDQPLQFSDYIIPICLPSNNSSSVDGESLTLTGWYLTKIIIKLNVLNF